MKKIVILIVVLLIVLLSCFSAFKLKNKSLSKEEFIALIKSSEKISNVKIEGNEAIQYRKGDIRVSYRKDGVNFWRNSKTNEKIAYLPNEKIYYLMDDVNSDTTGLEEMEYTFIGYEKYNNTRCAIGEFKIEDMDQTITIWIDANRGTCLKNINIGIDSEGNKFELIEEYTATYDIVIEEDVKKPDLSEYTKCEESLEK